VPGTKQLKYLAAAAVFALALPACVAAQEPAPLLPAASQAELLKGAGITQNLNAQVPLNLEFRDENAKIVRLGDYFGKRPVVLSLVYYNCPSLCTEVLNGELRALQDVSLDLGADYEAVTVSFDPNDAPGEAKVKKRIYMGLYGRRGSSDGWHFLTGQQEAIDSLTRAVGFRYATDKATAQFAHATVIMVLTPEGRISRYFYGIQYPSRDLRLSLVEASEGKIGSPVDAVLLFCFHYDPLTGKYGLVISNVIKAAGVVTILGLGIFLFLLFRFDARAHARAPRPARDEHGHAGV